MRISLLSVLLLILLGGGKTSSVEVKSMKFNPDSVTISAGGTVTWTNADDHDHSVTGSGMSSGKISPGGTYSYTFKKAGKYSYSCSFHPRMKGTVEVE